MSTSGGTGGFLKAAAGRQYILGGDGQTANFAPTAGSCRLYPVFLPFQTVLTQVGVNVAVAGAAGSTFVPTFYTVDQFGNPSALLAQGPALDTSAIAQVNAAMAVTLPAGYLWAGGLQLSAGGVPTLFAMSKIDRDPRGSLVPTDNAVGGTVLAFQNGLAAPPNPWAGTYISGAAPVLFVTT